MRDDSHLPQALRGLRLPLVASPMFILSGPELVIAQCKAGIIGSFPALNAREAEGEPPLLDTWLTQITEALDKYNQENPDRPAAPRRRRRGDPAGALPASLRSGPSKQGHHSGFIADRRQGLSGMSSSLPACLQSSPPAPGD